MTLVAGLSCGGMPAFLGDLLVSWRFKCEISLPTRPRLEMHPGANGDHAIGMAQKLIIVRPYLMIAWSGSARVIYEFIKYLDQILPDALSALDNVDLFLRPLDRIPDSVEVICIFGQRTGLYPICMHTKGYEFDNKRVYTLGTGAPEFISFLTNDIHSKNLVDERDGRLAKAILIRFVAEALMHQFSTGYGLAESWGGGFEIVYATEGRFKKIDGILVRAWKIDAHGHANWAPVMFLQHYEGSSLCISSIAEDTITTSIKSWVNENNNIPTRKKVVPEWIIDIIIDTRTSRSYHVVRNYARKSRSKTEFHFRNGMLRGWQMDEDEFGKIRKSINDFDQSTPMFFANYPWKYIPSGTS